MGLTSREPWKEYPEFWPTEAKFWSWLRGNIRRGLWEKSPIKLQYKNDNCEKPPEGYEGRAKSGGYCALSGVWTGKSKLEIDHCTGNVSLLCWEDLVPFIMHMIPERGTLQMVDKEMHKVKSYSERMGIDFREALAVKKAIELEKTKKVVAFLSEYGIIPASNAKQRRQQVIDKLLGEDK